MIRSRSIPPVLARAAGDGIHAILLTDADGELLGSYGSPPRPTTELHQKLTTGVYTAGDTVDVGVGVGVGSHDTPSTPANSTSIGNVNNIPWPPLDADSIGALISEVAGDYRRMGEELWLLDPQYHHKSADIGGENGAGHSHRERDQGGVKDDPSGGGSGGESEGGLRSGGDGDNVDRNGKGSQSQQQHQSDKHKGNLDGFGNNLKSLIIELDYVSFFLP